jgi:hypothetical protein
MDQRYRAEALRPHDVALIRDAVGEAYGRRDRDADLRAIDDALGTWRHRDLDGAAFVEAVRSGSRLDDSTR